MIKICKFGGSSVASAEQFKRVKEIVESDRDRRFIVVSAVGKRFAQRDDAVVSVDDVGGGSNNPNVGGNGARFGQSDAG